MTDQEMQELEQILRERGETVTTAESCTGGMVAARITDIAGSSDIFKRGFVTYCDQAKHEMLGVRTETLAKYTAVSEPTAREMAEGAAAQAKADAALSLTGYAGPPSGDDPDNGLVYIGCFYRGMTAVRECRFAGDRAQVRSQATETALLMLKDALTSEC